MHFRSDERSPIQRPPERAWDDGSADRSAVGDARPPLDRPDPPSAVLPVFVLDGAVARLNGRAWGMAVGVSFGMALFTATNVLVLQGESDLVAHLELLAAYFPGYEVTFGGSLVGFLYTFVVGHLFGVLIGTVYNRAAGFHS